MIICVPYTVLRNSPVARRSGFFGGCCQYGLDWGGTGAGNRQGGARCGHTGHKDGERTGSGTRASRFSIDREQEESQSVMDYLDTITGIVEEVREVTRNPDHKLAAANAMQRKLLVCPGATHRHPPTHSKSPVGF